MVDIDLGATVAERADNHPGPAQLVVILATASAALLGAALTPDGYLALLLLLLGTTLAAVATLYGLRAALWRHRRRRTQAMSERLLSADSAPGYLTETAGEVLYCNDAARRRFRSRAPTLGNALSEVFACPAMALQRLELKAERDGGAQDMVGSRRGHVQLSVVALGDGLFLWRIDEHAERLGAGRAAEALGLPMLTSGPTGTILYMNEACRDLTGGRARRLEALFESGPIVSGAVQRIRGSDGEVECLVAEIPASGGRREIYLLPPGRAGAAPAGGWQAEALPVALMRVSSCGRIMQLNAAAQALMPEAEVDGRLTDLLEGLGRPISEWLSEAVAERAVPGPQFLRGRGAHSDKVLQVTLGPPDDQGQIVAVLNDATEHKSLEAQFVQAQKMQAIGQLAGGIAHDFNNLLTAISGHCDLLMLRHDESDQDYGDLVQIHQNANRAASLVGQLLAFSRKQNLRLEQIDLRDTLSDLTHLLNRLVGERVTLSLNHDPDLREIRADKRQLEQVLMNLVVNARDAMPTGGEIRVETDNLDLETPLQRDRALVPAGQWVRIRVIDKGCGIPAEKIGKIFEPFYTTKRPGEGTGLGLSTAYGIVKQTGGFIFVDSTPGEGSVFTLLLPSRAANAAAAPEPSAEPLTLSPRRAEGMVLLVEDEAPVRAFAARALRMRGLSVIEAEDGEAALDILRDADLEVDIIVTDVIMPGKDGPTWVREAQLARPDVQVVFVSGYAEDDFSDQQAEIPNSTFLPKPFSLNELAATVERRIA
ncbi:ATP-binding protein [Limimaricola pyoseonensis]|uniref:histidine kinase n=1 Tax=Limimaricola pyoseonensis TaxID=521013 RepID=A0A1G6ZWZ7_9RHOB|nr:ATP-binding protein [Limimaricola pyoseonensis]SDE06893.1 two-component system, cell cycle sensor histidine kinase and response regulator CckA [Limimaricola pyoseonensis]